MVSIERCVPIGEGQGMDLLFRFGKRREKRAIGHDVKRQGSDSTEER